MGFLTDFVKSLTPKAAMPPMREYAEYHAEDAIESIISKKKHALLIEHYEKASDIDRHFIVCNMYYYDNAKFFHKLTRLYPDNYIAHLLYGAFLCGRVLDLRDGGMAEDLSEKTWQTIFDKAHMAHEALEAAKALNADDPQTLFPFIQVHTVISTDRLYIERAFDQVRLHNSHHYPLLASILNFYTKKWGGSYEHMFNFARNKIQKHPDSTCLQGLLAMAHIERWLGYRFDDEADQQPHYFENTELKEELAQAYSIFCSGRQKDGFHITATNHFAFAFYVSGQDELLKDALVFLDGEYLNRPWCYGQVYSDEVVFDALKVVGMDW